MARLIRVVLYAIVVLVLYFWVTSLLKSYQDIDELQKPVQIDTDSTSANMDTSEISGNDEILTDEDLVNSDRMYENLDKAIDQLSGDEKPKEVKPSSSQKPSVTQEKPRQENVNKSSATGSYMVIAGSFIKVENAKIQLKKLQSLGYNSAEIKIFVASEYHSVIVSRHPTESDAENVVRDLKNKGIESFVRQKK